jgi:hypothetical protein
MDVANTISILENLTTAVKIIPLAGDGLEAMLQVATQVCKSVEVCAMSSLPLEHAISDYAYFT